MQYSNLILNLDRFWLELGDTVRGNSLTIPSINSTGPKWTYFHIFANNTAHSNDDAGIRTYPHGMRPRINQVHFSQVAPFFSISLFSS